MEKKIFNLKVLFPIMFLLIFMLCLAAVSANNVTSNNNTDINFSKNYDDINKNVFDGMDIQNIDLNTHELSIDTSDNNKNITRENLASRCGFDNTYINSFDNKMLIQNQSIFFGNTIYVNSTQDGGDGKTPQTAYKTLSYAIENSCDGDTIMIASGTYVG